MKLFPTISAIILLLCASPARADWVMNGDFSTAGTPPYPFNAWSTFDAGGANAQPTAGGGFAVFTESTLLSGVQLEQMFDLPANARTLRFEFRLTSTPDATSGNPAPDSFQATLFTPGLLGTIAPANPLFPDQFPGFYSVDSGAAGAEFRDSSFVTLATTGDGWRQVSLDLNGIGPQPGLLLEFRLNGSDDGQRTTVELRDVRGLTNDAPATPVPAPAGAPVFVGMGACLLAAHFRRRAPSRA